MAEIWAAGGIGPARLAVMARVPEPRGYLLGRLDDRPAGAGFVALARPRRHAARPRGRRPSPAATASARAMTAAAAGWAPAQGATTFALAVTRAKRAALALYRRLGLAEAACYHYRALPA